MSGNIHEALKLAENLIKLRSENKLTHWEPFGKQKAFLDCSSHKKALVAGNQTGKSSTLMYEIATQLTGRYPKDWNGIRYNRPIEMWVVGVNSEKVRDNLQKGLLGEIGHFGTGFIPKDCMDFENGFTKKPGIPNAYQQVRVKHTSGGWSTLVFLSYEQEREHFQSSTIDIVCFDEEPPEGIHAECKMRVMVKKGYLLYAFTPLSSNPVVCRQLLEDDKAQIFSISMDDVPWLDEETITEMLKGLDELQARARRHGIPAIGGGQIFSFEPWEYSCDSFEIPSYWPRLAGMDIGYNHPTGAIQLAWDRETNIIYIYGEYYAKQKSASDVGRFLRHWDMPFAASHDAFNNNFQNGDCVANEFKKEGMILFSAGREVWARIEKARSLMSEGRLFIFKDKCPELMSQIRNYHTKMNKNNKVEIDKKDDDLVDAFTHAVANYEKAETQGFRRNNKRIVTVKEWKPFDKNIGV